MTEAAIFALTVIAAMFFGAAWKTWELSGEYRREIGLLNLLRDEREKAVVAAAEAITKAHA